jgi:N-hydroxyarylamine O-acetyltransferase
VRLDGESVMEKLVARRRGGYCFEHNGLLREVLTALGFPVEGLAARVLWNRPAGELGPRAHMLLRVVLTDGEFIADVGFGGLTLAAPLRLQTGLEQATPHEPHRLVPVHGETELQALLGGDWIPLYRFAMTPQLPIDYELANWFTATHPASPFPNELMMARPDTDRRFALLDRKFTTRHRDGRVERRELQDSADLGAVLAGDFKLALPEGDVAAVWERIAAPK